MTQNATCPPRVVGCDVGKSTITVFDTATGRTTELANTAETLLAFARGLSPDCLVVCEATGGYEAALLLATAGAGVPAHRADAARSRPSSARAARSARYRCPGAHPLRPGTPRRVAALAARRQGARRAPHPHPPAHSTRQTARRADQPAQGPPGGAIAKKHLGALHNAACRQITAIEADIHALIKHDPATAETVAIIEQIPGCGRITAVTVAALMPELGAMSGRTAASLAGLAPHPHQSGQRDGYRRTQGGRPQVCPKIL